MNARVNEDKKSKSSNKVNVVVIVTIWHSDKLLRANEVNVRAQMSCENNVDNDYLRSHYGIFILLGNPTRLL